MIKKQRDTFARKTDGIRRREEPRAKSGRNDPAPQLRFETVPIADLQSASRRVRRSERRHVADIRKCIETLGFVDPVLGTGDGEVIDGHIRLETASQAGLTEIPCIIIDHLSDDDVRGLRITLNRVQEKGKWDFDALKLEFEDLLEIEYPLEVTGFETPEIDLIIMGEEGQRKAEDLDPLANHLPEMRRGEPPISQVGDLWHLGRHSSYCGDARDPEAYRRLQTRRSIRAVITDPPYNVPIKGHVGGKGSLTADFSVGSVWGTKGDSHYLLHVERRRLLHPDLLKLIRRAAHTYGAHAVLIEDADTGKAVIQTLRREGKLPIIPIKPKLDKITRAEQQSATVEAGRVYLPQDAPWLAEFEHELLRFPNCRHDDQVDSFTQFLHWATLRRTTLPTLRVRLIGERSGVRDKYFERTGQSIFPF